MATDANDFDGFCPGCNDSGPLAEACPEKACSAKGYHYIPSDFRSGRRLHPLVGVKLGDYLLVKVLGAGGFGTVFLSHQLPIGLNCAVKLLHWDGSTSQAEEALRRFRNEAFALARISHPNVVRLVHYGSSTEGPFLVMEFVDSARTLADEMENYPPPWQHARVYRVLSQLLNGLQAAHEAGVLHRDIKPHNLMMQTARGYPDFLRILDFGLARFAEAQSSSTRASGTPAYLAPEQLDGHRLGPWTDLYAVGVLAFQLLTGRLPYDGQTIAEIFKQKCDRRFDPSARIEDPVIRRGAAEFFRRALAVNPDARFQDVDGFRDELSAALVSIAGDHAQSPVTGPPDPPSDVPSASDPRWFSGDAMPIVGAHSETLPFGAGWIDPPGLGGTLGWFRRSVDFRAVPATWPFPPPLPFHAYSAVRVRFCREAIASAQSEMDIAPVLRAFGECRAFLGRAGAPRLPIQAEADDPVLRLTLPDTLLASSLGLTARHLMDRVSEEWLHAQPSALLLLNERPHDAGSVKREEPISEFFRWSVRQLTSYCRDEIESAYKRFRAEQRFRATFPELDEEDRETVGYFWWTELHHALSNLFHPECGQVKLLECAKRYRVPNMTRLIRALRKWGELKSDDPTILELPPTHGRLVRDGVGDAVLGDLCRLTIRHMRLWRYASTGVTPPAPPPPLVISIS